MSYSYAGNDNWKDNVYIIETTDPVQGGIDGVANLGVKNVADRTIYLKNLINSLQSTVANIDTVSSEEVVGLRNAVDLDWLYNQNRIAFEFFDSVYTLMDTQDKIGGVYTVNEDDSIDIEDTSQLQIGQEYVITDGVNTITVVVAEIFSGTRFRAENPVSINMIDAELMRTNFDISGEGATAESGDFYFANDINLDNSTDAAIIVRHTGAPSDIRIFYQDSEHSSWTEVFWKWHRDLGTGEIDVEYVLPARGYFDLKVECEASSSIDLSHIVCVGSDTGLKGTHHAPETPVNVAPADGANELQETPTMQGSSYNSLVGADQFALQVQVSTDEADFSSPVHDSDTQPAGTSYNMPRGVLSTGTTYYFRLRYQDVEGTWSEWSTPTSFVTAASFEYVMTPTNVSPDNGAASIPEQPTLSATDFETDGFEKTSLSDGTTDLWTNSGTTSGEYYYTGSALGGKPSAVYANGIRLTEGELGSLANGEWAFGDQDSIDSNTVYIKTADGDPDAQAADYVQAGEVHIASQWQIRTSSGDYSSPAYDSGEVDDLTTHVVPAGILEEGQNTYYFRVRYKSENIGLSEWSSETSFTTKEMFAQVFGIALESTGGGAGSWQNIDGDGNNASLGTTDFNNHAIWGGIEDVTIDGQDTVKIPKFYVKQDVAPAGSDQAGNKCWWVSDNPIDGYVVHPAFMDGGAEIDQVYVGKYECTDDGGTKAGSVSGVSPLVDIDFPTMQTRCEARNEANGGNTGVDGFHLWSIYELSAVQLLALIELGTPDAQSAIAEGNVNSSSAQNTGATSAVWRGIYELWGNVRHWTDGLSLDGGHQVKIWDIEGNRTFVSTGINTTSSDGWGITLHDETGADFNLGLIFLPKTTDSTEGNGTLADYLYASDSGEDNVCTHGGAWSDGSKVGLFDLDLHHEASNSYTYIGGRLGKW